MRVKDQILWRYNPLVSIVIFTISMVSLAQGAVYPDLQGVVEPTANYPESFSTLTPPIDSGVGVDTKVPQISEWTRQSRPGDTMALTGEALSAFSGTAEGCDTRFVFFGESGVNGASIKQTEAEGFIQRLDGQQCAITLPDNLPPNEVYLMWPHNDEGFGEPVVINQPEAWWVGFDQVARGEQFFVYGRNLKLGDGECHIYIKELDRWLTSTNANPYKAPFMMPADIENGTYTIFVHNGHGARYGWSDSLSITVKSAYEWTGKIYNVEDYGASGSDANEDSTGINAAIAAAGTSGNTVYFPEGTYYINSVLYCKANVKYVGAGKDLTTITQHPSMDGTGFRMVSVWSGANNFQWHDMTLSIGNTTSTKPIGMASRLDVVVNNVKFTDEGCDQDIFNPISFSPANFSGNTRLKVSNCDFVGGEVVFNNSRQIRVENCTFKGRWDIGQITSLGSTPHIDFNHCVAENYSTADQSSGSGWAKGRFLVTAGAACPIYIGDNETRNLGPRQPTSYYGPDSISSVSAFADEHYINLFGKLGFQTLSFASIPSHLNSPTPPSRSYAGSDATITVNVGGKITTNSYQIWTIDAANNTATILVPSWNIIPTSYTSASAALKDKTDQNSGEQILFEGVVARFSGTPLTVTDTTMTFADTGFLDHALSWGGKVACIVQGKGLGQYRMVSGIAGDTVTLESPWRVLPDTSSIVRLGAFVRKAAIYNNTLDGRPSNVEDYTATTGLNVYGGAVDLVYDHNTISEVREGITPFAEANSSYYSTNSLMPVFPFNVFDNNTISNCHGDVALIDSLSGTKPAFDTGLTFIGNVFRNNTTIGATDSVFSFSVDTPENFPIKLNVFQGNRASFFTAPIAVVDTEGVENQVWIGNTFHGDSRQTGYTIAANHTPALRENNWINFNPTYGGNLPGAKVEMPKRHSELRSNITQVKIPVWNSGTDPMSWVVKKITDAPWLGVSSSGAPVLNETGVGLITLDVLDPLPTADSQAILSISDGVNEQQVTITYVVQGAQFHVDITTYTLPAGIFRVEVVDQETQARRDLGAWYGPCSLPVEDSPAAGTIIIEKQDEETKDWILYQSMSKGDQPGLE